MATCLNCQTYCAPEAIFCGGCGRPVSASPRPLARPTVRTVVIGRDPACDYVIDHAKISGRHCQLSFEDGRLVVTDLGSSNGTFVGAGKRRVAGSAVVANGECLFLGPCEVAPAAVARAHGIDWPAPGARAVQRTVLHEEDDDTQAAAVAAQGAALQRERESLRQEREANERTLEAARQMARAAELAATRAAAEAEHAQALADARAASRDQRTGYEKGTDAASAVAGFGLGCIGWVIAVLVILAIAAAVVAKGTH